MDSHAADWVVKDYRFASGETIPELRLHYHTLGAPRDGADGTCGNAVLLLHNTSGSSDLFLQDESAQALFGDGGPLDPGEYYVIIPDAIGHGATSKPSNGLKASFPHYTYGDMIDAQHRLVTDGLGISTLRLVLGVSMGAMHTWMWAERFPDMMRAAVAIASEPEAVKGRNLLWRRLVIDAIRSDPGYRDGDYDTQPHAVGFCWNLMNLLISGVADLEDELPDIPAADGVIQEVDKIAREEHDANDLLYQIDASRDYDPAAGLEAITASFTAINFETDNLNPPELTAMDQAIQRVRSGKAITVPSGPRPGGHISALTPKLWAQYVRTALEESAN